MEKKKLFNKGFFKRFIICFLAYALLMGGIISSLGEILTNAHIAIKIVVGVAIVLLFIGLIVYVELTHRRKEK